MRNLIGSTPLSRCSTTMAALVLLIASSAPGCDSAFDLQNAVPRVTWVAVEPVDAELSRIHIWISDLEGDSVDLDARWVDASGVATPIALAPGSYGLIGLPTRGAIFDPNGQPHLVLWDTRDVGPGQIKLRFTPDDRPREADAGVGETVETPAFDPSAGLLEPVRVVTAP